MSPEIERLQALLEACNRVLENLDPERGDEIATALRETCRLVEVRLAELARTDAGRHTDMSKDGR